MHTEARELTGSDIPDVAPIMDPPPLDDFIAEEERGPFLSQKQESQLIRRLRRGDECARATLISAHMPLVRAVARGYRNKGLSQEDLLQEGYMGLLRAADRFREGLGTRFSSYATWWIREGMQRALIRSRFIRLPDYLAKSLHAYLQREEEEGDVGARREQRREALGVRESTMRALDFADIRVYSLDDDSDDGPSRIEQVIGDVAGPDNDYDRDAICRALRVHVAELNEKQREVMMFRYGMYGGAPMTLEAVADRMGVSREAVRQLQVRALARLRQSLSESGWGS
ncbi:sigma-70 family RNA polymerase sigma factor [Acidithiobacillus ferrianus]|uniref:Sigma-70 family RNA polymerase sigma factor n=2 Tax=Acidithiobacillus ferrianus TaxID=2678518 RepID=A0A845U7D8_9PROT|nr:sigma-70 family RNA polymerase sigma factor [Acidithiobacillus ferrianus]NDU43326.1 sigma-70 family RNA polymerase sigma factor [Acidithiobacillus ferrianus]